MAPLSAAIAIQRPVSPCLTESTAASSNSSDAGSDDSFGSDRDLELLHEAACNDADDGIVEWQALLTSTPLEGESSSLFSETPDTFVGIERPAQQPPPPPVLGVCDVAFRRR